jgi:phosphoribosylanthranilate isomerase
MQIKVCGITDRANMLEVARLRPEYMGFIFYEASPRDVTNKLPQLGLADLPPAIDKVAVFVDHDVNSAISLIGTYGFEAVQLHGNETPSYCKVLSDHCMVIKAFSVGDRLPAELGSYEGCCDMFLFDAMGQHRGGNGKPFNHAILNTYDLLTPFFLSGGISPGDAHTVRELARGNEKLTGVDINSRFEISPGIKDTRLLIQFIKGIR